MSVRIVFRCQFCDDRPDPETQVSLEHLLREFAFGEYLDALPGRWLVWQGNGLLGPVRYSCENHRGDLTAFLRSQYGTVAPQPWKRPPYPTTVRTEGTDRALKLKAQGGHGFF